MEYRQLTAQEIEQLKSQGCSAEDWDRVLVADGFNPKYVRLSRFSGDIRLGVFEVGFDLPGGIHKHSGLYNTTLHNVQVGNNTCIEDVGNYIANYHIGNNSFIGNIDSIIVDGVTSFGNGVEAAVLNETGGREVPFYDRLSAQQAYILALYRYRPALVDKIKALIGEYVESVKADFGTIGDNVTIMDTGTIRNVKIGDNCVIEGASRLKNGSINSNASAPVHIGEGVIADDFIIGSGSSVDDNVTLERCFIGQACIMGHSYSASDSLFFSNCHEENGEACAIFAGPYTVTHHKSTLLIAGMFSFMNAGSGSNQSNHMYKLGPIHQGILERGAKTASDSYVLWPAKVGAFSLVMGRHTAHMDTSNLPYSYLLEDKASSYIAPGANIKSVGTIRDAMKWPRRDKRKDPDKLDYINFNILSPYTMQKVLKGIEILRSLRRSFGPDIAEYPYQGGWIRSSSLNKGLNYYSIILDKFLGNSLVSRIGKSKAETWEELLKDLRPDSEIGLGSWVDVSGLICPKNALDPFLDQVEEGVVSGVDALDEFFSMIYSEYYSYEWTWAYDIIRKYYGVSLDNVSPKDVLDLIARWKEAVVGLDNLLYEDAKKEFSLSFMTSFGEDGDQETRLKDFEQVRGSDFEGNPFVQMVKNHIKEKTALYESTVQRIKKVAA
ncbi:MAG: DUF4954 family protein [Bacteroidales bacterium]|nr:DUF4954 family protein [Bacteroidales bacterium]MBQ2502083.1 DUF4954 family protein [Bacteroidales bacterium]